MEERPTNGTSEQLNTLNNVYYYVKKYIEILFLSTLPHTIRYHIPYVCTPTVNIQLDIKQHKKIIITICTQSERGNQNLKTKQIGRELSKKIEKMQEQG